MIIPESVKAAARSFTLKWQNQGFVPQTIHTYTDSEGVAIYWRARLKHPTTGQKKFLPLYQEGQSIIPKQPKFPCGTPLYNLQALTNGREEIVWIVEGEKCANVLSKIGVIATTSGGADSSNGADWGPLSKRKVIVWPDNNEAGLKYAKSVKEHLLRQECIVEIIDVSKVTASNQDSADWYAEHPKASIQDLYALPREVFKSNPDKSPVPTSSDSALNVVDLYDLLSMEIPIREKILPWMPAQSLCMIHAWRGIGKTHVALGISYAIAAGGNFLNWQVSKPRKVLYIDGEMPACSIQERLAKIASSSEREVAPDQLKIITPDLQHRGLPDLATSEGQAIVDKAVGDVEVIVIDNLSCLVRGAGKENEADSWLAVQQWALSHRSAGRSILFIHHSGKSGSQRGTSKKEDLLDTIICLKRPSDYEHTDGAVFEVHFEKARHLFGDEVSTFMARLTETDGKQCWETSALEETNFEKVVQLHKDNLSQNEIADELNLNKSTVSRHLRRAREDGLISKDAQRSALPDKPTRREKYANNW